MAAATGLMPHEYAFCSISDTRRATQHSIISSPYQRLGLSSPAGTALAQSGLTQTFFNSCKEHTMTTLDQTAFKQLDAEKRLQNPVFKAATGIEL